MEPSASSSQSNIVSRIENNLDLGQMSIVLDLSLPDSRAVVGEEDELGCSVPDSLEGGFEAQGGLSRFEDEAELGVDTFRCLFLHHVINYYYYY